MFSFKQFLKSQFAKCEKAENVRYFGERFNKLSYGRGVAIYAHPLATLAIVLCRCFEVRNI